MIFLSGRRRWISCGRSTTSWRGCADGEPVAGGAAFRGQRACRRRRWSVRWNGSWELTLSTGRRAVSILIGDGERYLTACETLVDQLTDVEPGLNRAGSARVERWSWRPAALCAPIAATRLAGIPPTLSGADDRSAHGRSSHHHLFRGETGVDALIVLGWPIVADLVVRKIAQMLATVCATPGYWAEHGVPTRPKDLEIADRLSVRNLRGPAARFPGGSGAATSRRRPNLTAGSSPNAAMSCSTLCSPARASPALPTCRCRLCSATGAPAPVSIGR